jgi:hypothetical protein
LNERSIAPSAAFLKKSKTALLSASIFKLDEFSFDAKIVASLELGLRFSYYLPKLAYVVFSVNFGPFENE